ncbi:UNVERIFIED_CONTAM: hypothetical protein DES50_10532 [Williamsia faeni]
MFGTIRLALKEQSRNGFKCQTAPLPTLTECAIEVLRTWRICDTKEAAARILFITAATVNTHISRFCEKCDAAGRAANTKAALLVRAMQDGLITVEEL